MKKENKLGKAGKVIDVIIRCVLLAGIIVVLIIHFTPTNEQMFEIRKETSDLTGADIVPEVNIENAAENMITDNSGNAVSDDDKININTATAHELRALDGIGETKAYAIIEYREEHGDFQSIDELSEVSGIGEKTVDKLRDKLTV